MVATAAMASSGAQAASGGQNLAVSRVIDQYSAGSATSCVIMNDKMDSGNPAADQAMLNKYVSVKDLATGKPAQPNFLVNNRSICISGLEYGAKYRITLKKGLVSASNRIFKQDKDLDVTTVDRNGTVNFANGNVLSLSAPEKNVAIQTVNMEKFNLSLFRISQEDRASSDFAPLSDDNDRWSRTSLARGHGTLLASKQITVKNDSNRNVTTLVDLKSLAGGELGAGTYLLFLTADTQPLCQDDFSCIDDVDYDKILLTKSVVITDLGVTTYKRDDRIDVAVRSLTTAEPVSGAKVSLYSQSNELLASATADASGFVSFKKSDVSGYGARTPTLLNITSGKDRYVQDLRNSSLNIEGAGGDYALPRSSDLNVYSYTNRTMVRPGEKVLFNAIVRDGKMNAADIKALKLMVYRPDGNLYREFALNDPKSGAFSQEFEFAPNAAFGYWRFEVGFDRKHVLSTANVTVDNFIPSSIKAKISAGSDFLSPADQIIVNTRFLYDAPAPEIAIGGSYTLEVDRHPVPSLEEYFFGPMKSADEGNFFNLDDFVSDRSGNARVDLSDCAGTMNDAPSKLKLRLNVSDPNNKMLNLSKEFKMAFQGSLVGLKPDFSRDDPYQTDFSVLISDQSGKLSSGEVQYTIAKRNISYQYVYENGSWNYIRNETQTPVVIDRLNVSGKDSRLKAKLADGSYLITLSSGGMVTTHAFNVGFASEFDPNQPDRFALFADRKAYKPGDTATLEFDSLFDGYADVMLDGVSDLALTNRRIAKGHNKIEVKLPASFNRGSYALVSLYSPASFRLGAQRSLGVVFLNHRDSADRTLSVTAQIPPLVKPNSGVDFSFKVDGAEDGTYLTAALVDEGILSINRQKSPAPDKAFFGQYALDTALFDPYNHLMKNGQNRKQGYGGDEEDEGVDTPTLNNITKNLFTYYSLPVKVENGKATVHFDLNDVSTTARLMVSAWSPTRVGSLSQKVPVKDYAVTRLNAPFYLHDGDVMQTSLSINNLSRSDDTYQYSVSCRGVLKCAKKGSLEVAAGQLSADPVSVTAFSAGDGFVDIEVSGKDYRFKTTREITAINRFSRMTENQIALLKPNESVSLPSANAFEDGSKAVARFGQIPLTDVGSMVESVLKYSGYGIFDETASGMLLLDALSILEKDSKTSKDQLTKITGRIGELISAVENRFQYGSLSLNYYIDSLSMDVATIGSALFLYRADQAGFNVSRDQLRELRNRIESFKDSERAIKAAMSMYALAAMGVNVHTDAVFYFDRLTTEALKGDKAQAVDTMAWFSDLFALYGDAKRQKEAVKQGLRLLDNAQTDTKLNFRTATFAQIMNQRAALLNYFPTEANTVTHDAVNLVRAALNAGDTASVEKLYGYLNADSYFSLSSKAVMMNMAARYKADLGKAVSSVKNGAVALTNPSSEVAAATVTITGDVTSAGKSDGYVTITQKIYNRKGQLLKPPYKFSVNETFLVVNNVTFKTPYTGYLRMESKIPANAVVVSELGKSEMQKQYPALVNNTFFNATGKRTDTAMKFDDHVSDMTSISYAYELKAVYAGTSAALMGSAVINKVQSRMYNFFDPAGAIIVK